MRTLNPVGIRERFVASGVYEITLDGVPSPAREEWSIHELEDQALLVRVDHDWVEAGGSLTLTEALFLPTAQGLRLLRLNQKVFADRLNQHTRKQSCVLQSGEARIVLVGRDAKSDYNLAYVLPVNAEHPVYTQTDSILLTGLLVDGIMTADEAHRNVHEIIITPEEVAVKKAALTLTSEPATLDSYPSARIEKMTLHHADRHMLLWLDQHMIALQYQSSSGVSAVLRRYARRPEPKQP
ncbi:MAG: hypothetical protein SF029_25125 [bacterium]|nr:hypothetical protein [bacterium]